MTVCWPETCVIFPKQCKACRTVASWASRYMFTYSANKSDCSMVLAHNSSTDSPLAFCRPPWIQSRMAHQCEAIHKIIPAMRTRVTFIMHVSTNSECLDRPAVWRKLCGRYRVEHVAQHICWRECTRSTPFLPLTFKEIAATFAKILGTCSCNWQP